MWSYTAGDLKIKVQEYTNSYFGAKIGGLVIKVVLK